MAENQRRLFVVGGIPDPQPTPTSPWSKKLNGIKLMPVHKFHGETENCVLRRTSFFSRRLTRQIPGSKGNEPGKAPYVT